MVQIIHKELSYVVRGVLLDVFNALGPMLKEEFYRDAIVIGLIQQGILCHPEKEFEVYYRGELVGRYYIDIWIENGKIILEIKVVPEISPLHRAQAISYIKVSDADLAIVVSFGSVSLSDERLPNFLRNRHATFKWQPKDVTEDLLFPDLSNQVLQALHRVHFELGPGFFHQVYRRATMVELKTQAIPYDYIEQLPVTYLGQYVGAQDVRLILVNGQILLATIAVKTVDDAMTERLRAYMRRLDTKLGIIANFHGTTLELTFVRL